jgi:glucokinase
MATKCYLVWDLGATKCAAAVVTVDHAEYRVIASAMTLLRDESSLHTMAEKLHAQLNINLQQIDGICIAAAGCYDGSVLQLASGYPFSMNFAQVATDQRWPYFEVVHDYTPVVASTFICQQQEGSVLMLRQGQLESHGRRVAFGVGTGLGLKDAVLTSNGGVWFGENEVGHIGVLNPPLMTAEKAALHRDFMRFLADDGALSNKPVSFETILSGQGFSRCYRFITGSGQVLSPPQVQSLIDAGCAYREQMLSFFAWYLGLFVGSLQLTFMPSGGVWLGGGVLQKNLSLFQGEAIKEFWSGVACSPAYTEQRKKFPIGVMLSHELIFMGGAFYADNCFPVQESRQVVHSSI